MTTDYLANVDMRALHVMWLMTQAGYETRLCGGAVRDLLRGISPKDWDMATVATPEQVIEVMNSHDIHVIPTGLQHGTVTAVFDGEHFEITTLRIDTDTDGRHATVQYTDDWVLDAHRRDFTMNALYMDADGVVHDYVGGHADLANGYIKFVGNAEDRIQEDYLRILRFFRFKARMISDASGFDWRSGEQDAKAAIQKHRGGLNDISGERIWMEMSKIIQCPIGAHPTISAMGSLGVLHEVGLVKMTKRSFRLSSQERRDDRPSVLLASTHNLDDIADLHAYMCDGLKMSKAETRPVEFFLANQKREVSRESILRLSLDHDKSDILGWLAIAEGISPQNTTKRSIQQSSHVAQNTPAKLYEFARDLVVPTFPVTGKDLMDLGMKPGPQMGDTIRQLKDVWANLEYGPDKDYLMNLVHITGGNPA